MLCVKDIKSVLLFFLLYFIKYHTESYVQSFSGILSIFPFYIFHHSFKHYLCFNFFNSHRCNSVYVMPKNLKPQLLNIYAKFVLSRNNELKTAAEMVAYVYSWPIYLTSVSVTFSRFEHLFWRNRYNLMLSESLFWLCNLKSLPVSTDNRNHLLSTSITLNG